MKFFHTITRFASALAVVLLCGAGVANAQWEAVSPVPTANIWGFASAYHNGKIYTFGGVINNSTAITNATYSLDISAPGNNWSTSNPNMLAGTYFHSAVSLNNRIYIFGGQNGNQTIANFFNTASSFDPAGGSFRQEATMPRVATSAAAVAVGTKAYVLGGITLQGNSLVVTPNILVYDAVANSWSEITNGMPYVAYGMMATTMPDGTIYMAGGQAAGGGGYTNAYKGTVSGNSIAWTPIANLPSVIANGGMSLLEGEVMIGGGISATENFRGAYVYDEAGNKWDAYYQLPETHSSGALVGDGVNPYMIAGAGTNVVQRATVGDAVAVADISQTKVFLSAKPGTQTSGSIAAGNLGVAELQISATVPGSAPWLTVPNVTVAGGMTGQVAFNANAGSLAPGTYNAKVTLTTNDENNPTHEVDVYLFVGDPGVNQETKVVIEEGSGDWCGWCPQGHDVLKQVEQQFGDQIIVLSYHGGSATEPLMINEGSRLVQKLGLPGWPSASIQRLIFPGNSVPMTSRSNWAAYTQAVLSSQPTAPVELTVENYVYNEGTRTVTADVTVKTGVWLDPDDLHLTAVVTQEGIITSQVDYVNGNHSQYEQPHTVRYVWPNENGQSLSFNPDVEQFGYIPPGASVTTSVEFTVPQRSGTANMAIDPAASDVAFVAHINYGTQLGPILQGFQRELVSGSVGPAVTIDFPGPKTKEIDAMQTAEYQIGVTNHRGEPVEVTIQRAADNMPDGWHSEICTGSNDCDDADQINFTIPGNGSHTFTVKIYGGTPEETGNVRVIVSAGGVEDDETYTANTRASSSVAVPGELRGLSMTEVTPNPASTVTRIDVTIPTGAETVLEVYSITGRKVATLFEGRLEAGNRQIDANVSSLESGKYVLVLTSGDKKVSRTLTIVR